MNIEGQWQSWNAYKGQVIPESRKRDLQARGSLTERLLVASAGDFRVNVLSQRWQLPEHDESLCLGIPESEEAMVREVELICRGQPWVMARSVIPKCTLEGHYGFLADLGDKPLGEIIFQEPNLKRTSFEVCKVNAVGEMNTPHTWGRRSVFTLGRYPILVAEFFLTECPSLYKD